RAEAADLGELIDAFEEANAALADAGYELIELDNDDVIFATEGDDLYVFGNIGDNGEAATISDFGFVGNDVLFVGDKYTFNDGDFATDGDDSVLEFFIEQVGANSVIRFEIDPFSSNPNADTSFTVTLT